MRRPLAPRPSPGLTPPARPASPPPPRPHPLHAQAHSVMLAQVPPVAPTPPPRYALWDRTHRPWGDADPAYGVRTWRNRQWRHEARTADFDAAADGRADPAPLAAEYADRVEALRRRAEPFPPSPHRPPTPAPAPRSRLNESLRVLAPQLPLILVFAVVSDWMIALGLIPLAVALSLALIGRDRVHRFIHAIDHRRCPDCGYDLTGAPPAIDPTRLAGADVGPRLCPECGSPWPLLPPPATCSIDTLPPSLRRPIPARPQASQTHPAPQPPVPPTTA